MALVKRLSENQGARIFHSMIIPACVLVKLLSFVSIGTLTNINQRAKDEYDDLHWDGRCILYTRAEDLDHHKYNDGGECVFVLWGGIVLALWALVLSIVLGVKTFFGVAV